MPGQQIGERLGTLSGEPRRNPERADESTFDAVVDALSEFEGAVKVAVRSPSSKADDERWAARTRLFAAIRQHCNAGPQTAGQASGGSPA